MRDNFYHFLIVALFMSMFFGAETARMAAGGPATWVNIVMSLLMGAFAIVGAVSHYRKAKRAATQPQEQS